MLRLSSRQAGVLVSYAYSITQIVVQLLYVPILLNGIGQSEYGLYQFVGSVMAYLSIINTVLASGVTKFYSKAFIQGDEQLKENTLAIAKRLYWLVSVLSAIAVMGIGFIVVVSYQQTFSGEQLNEMGMMFIVLAIDMVIVMNNTINIAAITANERFIFLRMTQLLTAVIQPVLVVVFMQVWQSALMVTVMTLCANAVCALLQRIYAQNVLKTKYTYHGMDRELVRNLLAFSATVVLVALSDQIFWKSGQLVLGFFYGPDLIAVFAIGAQIYSVYMVLGTSVASVFLPRVTEIYLHSQNRQDDLSFLFIKVGRVSFFISFLVLVGFTVLGEEFIYLWAGPSYGDAYLVALIVMVPFTVDIIQNLGLTILQVADRYQFRGYVNITIAVLNVILTVMLAQSYGVVGVAASTALSIFIGNGIIMNWYYGKKIKLDILSFWKSIARAAGPLIVAAVTLYAAWHILDVHGWVSLICFALVILLVYSVVAFFLCFNDDEKAMIMRRIGRIR